MTKDKIKELHENALDLMKRINSDIANKARVETLNIMMSGVVKELNGQLIEDALPKTRDNEQA